MLGFWVSFVTVKRKNNETTTVLPLSAEFTTVPPFASSPHITMVDGYRLQGLQSRGSFWICCLTKRVRVGSSPSSPGLFKSISGPAFQ
ncbi:hypothetical protein COP2_009633 [Malus domestica]